MPSTAELLDLSTLVPSHIPEPEDTDEPRHIEPTDEVAVLAIDRVVRRWPAAKWITFERSGRIVAGDVFLSLPIALVVPDAELVAWIDAARRLGRHSTR